MEVNRSLIAAILAGWIPAVAVLFRLLGPRRATLIAILGGYLFLPSLFLEWPIPGAIGFGKPHAIGLGLVLGILCCDRSSLWRARPRWLDLPMVAFAISPLLGFLTGGRLAPWDVADTIFQRTTGWLVPYATGRLYFGDDEGARRIGVGVVVGALLMVPVCAFEAVLGPSWYLNGLFYGIPYREGMVARLGGWRPEGFLGNGIELATWMALGAVSASWLWGGGAWRPRRGPSWWPSLVLFLAAAACRGIYGYLTLGLGLAAALTTQALRTRWVLVALALLAPTYMTLRLGGLWDARSLPKLAGFTGRAGSVGFRIEAEDAVMKPVLARHPALGFGVPIWHAGVVRETLTRWPDGAWLSTLWEGGLLGLALSVGAMHLFPSGLALARPSSRPSRRDASSPAWGLVLFSILNMTDSLHNPSRLVPTALIAGALVGRALARPERRSGRTGTFPEYLRPTIAPPSRREATPTPANRPGPNLIRLAVALLLLATPEILDAAWRLWSGRAAPEVSRPSGGPIRDDR